MYVVPTAFDIGLLTGTATSPEQLTSFVTPPDGPTTTGKTNLHYLQVQYVPYKVSALLKGVLI